MTDKVQSILDEEKAQAMLERWVQVLHLEGWDICFEWKVRGEDMNLADSLGATTYNVVGKQAVVQMLDPIDFSNCKFNYDYEKTLVHELLHLKFAELDDTGDALRDKLTHCMVDDMARALVDVKRGAAC